MLREIAMFGEGTRGAKNLIKHLESIRNKRAIVSL